MFCSNKYCAHPTLQAVKESHYGVHLVGKIRRLYLIHCRKGYVNRQLALRRGECHQCGRCCSFLYVCPMLTKVRLCRIYRKYRLEVCKMFPIHQRDIEEVVLNGGRCGYRFETGSLEKMSWSKTGISTTNQMEP